MVYFGPHHLEAEIKRRYYFISDVLVIGLFISSIGLILKILNSYNIYWLSLRFVGTPVDPLIWRLGARSIQIQPCHRIPPPLFSLLISSCLEQTSKQPNTNKQQNKEQLSNLSSDSSSLNFNFLFCDKNAKNIKILKNWLIPVPDKATSRSL